MTHDVAKTVDASGDRCPMPILKAKKAIGKIEVGEILQLIATDIGTKHDMPTLAKKTGHEIVELVEEGDKLVWYIRRTK